MPLRLNCLTMKSLAAFAAGACLISSPVWGTVITPGSGPTVTPGLASLAGLTQIADETVPFVGTDVFSNVEFTGTMESTVYAEPSGTLDFAYEAISTAGPDAIQTVSVNSYTDFTTDVDYIAGSGNVTYDTASRLAFGAGDTISFNFAPNGIPPTESADEILIRTNALSFDDFGTTSFIDGGSGSVNTFEPATVPEPMSMTLLLAVGGSALMSRRSRRKI